MNIETAVYSVLPYKSSSYQDFLDITEKSYVKLSFFGHPHVYSVGMQGSIPLEDLAKEITELMQSNINYNEDERAIGKKLHNRVSHLYDVYIQETQLMGRIRSFIFFVLNNIFKENVRINNAIDDSNCFRYYTENQYKSTFNEEPQGKPTNRPYDNYRSSYNFWKPKRA